MLKRRYARWMYEWETRLTTRDENRVVRPLEWGFEWLTPFLEAHGFDRAIPRPEVVRDPAAAEAAMVQINQLLIRNSDQFFGYERPTDFRLEERYPQLYPTNVRPETLAQDAAMKQQAADGALKQAQYLRFTSPERPPTKIQTGPSRRLLCCRSGTPTALATTRSAQYSIEWESPRSVSPCPTTISAGRQSSSAPTIR
jgi:hypothetical protein